ncbi:hypothetical protein MKX01_039951 [Papaver californicum]|nr:hypothetical protein MKX01_039951 [Papaver californicum]
MTRFNGGGDDDDHRKLIEDYNSEQEEEEALSLCDLPIKEEVNQQNIKSNKAASLLEQGEEFEFGSWVGSVLTESEICVADDVFFQGQILPLRRHSVSSENGFSIRRQDSNPSVTMNPSRSSSMDRSSSGFYTTSSRSSSSKSHNSISSTSTSTTTSGHYKPLQNIFHSHPSPKPQIWNSSSNSKSIRRNGSGRTGKQSTTWGLFRVGLVKTPQIELQDLRLGNYKSVNSSCSSSGSSNKSSSIKNICSTDTNNGSNMRRLSKGTGNDNGDKKKMQRFYLGFESCNCSIDAVENSVSSKFVVIKSSLINSKKKIMCSSNGSELMKEGVILKKEKEDDHHIDDEKDMTKKEKKEEEKKKQKELMNHLRTFEWLKELSVADVPD